MISNIHIAGHCNHRSGNLEYFRRVVSSRDAFAIPSKGRQTKTSAFRRYHLLRRRNVKVSRSQGSKKLSKAEVTHIQRSRIIKRRLWKRSLKPMNPWTSASAHCLETHIMHSKRMHMKRIYGFILPSHHKNYGLDYIRRRVLKKKAGVNPALVVHDMSHHAVYEVHGSKQQIDNMLPLFIDMNQLHVGRGEGSDDVYVEEQVLMFHQRDCFPSSCIGPITLSFIQQHVDMTKIYIQCHPSIAPMVKSEIIDGINMMNSAADIPDDMIPAPGLSFHDLQDHHQPLRFSIRGIGSQRFLHDALTKLQQLSHHISSSQSSSLNIFSLMINSHNSMNRWRDGQVLCCSLPDLRLAQISSDNLICASHHQPSSSSSSSSSTQAQGKHKFIWPHPSLMRSVLWQYEMRSQLVDAMISNQAFHHLIHHHYQHSYQLSSSSSSSSSSADLHRLQHMCAADRIPIQIIRKLSSTSSQALNGFDIIVPLSYGRAFLQQVLLWPDSIIAGYEEMSYLHREAAMLSFPRDYIDTAAGIQYWQQRYEEDLAIEHRRPPAKRRHVGTSSISRFINIMQERVIHDHDHDEQQMQELVAIRADVYAASFDISASLSPIAPSTTDMIIDDIEEVCPALPSILYPAIIHVCITPTSKGMPHDGDLLYVPPIDAYVAWLHHHMHRSDNMIGNKRKRLAEWRGCKIQQPSASYDKDDIIATQDVIGVVTSGINPRLMRRYDGKFMAIGACDAMRFYESQRQVIIGMIQRHDGYDIQDIMTSKAYALVFFHRAGSSWLRPALLHILTST